MPVLSGSETMRAVVTPDRAVLVSGSSVYDISNCPNPVLKGQIQWPPLSLPGIPTRLLPHDIRVNRAGTKVYASFGVWEADITNLDDSTTWTVTDHRCELAAQQPGPWSPVHLAVTQCRIAACASMRLALRPWVPTMSSRLARSRRLCCGRRSPIRPTLNADGTRLYVGDQAGGTSALWAPVAKVRIIDLSQSPPQILGEVDGPGHGLDWFRTANGREYVVHSNEGGSSGIPGQAAGGDTCQPYPRPFSLSWGFEVFVSDVTEPRRCAEGVDAQAGHQQAGVLRGQAGLGARPLGRLPHGRQPAQREVCGGVVRKRRAARSSTSATRAPEKTREVAYFNHGPLVHAGVSHYDAARGLLYVPADSRLPGAADPAPGPRAPRIAVGRETPASSTAPAAVAGWARHGGSRQADRGALRSPSRA